MKKLGLTFLCVLCVSLAQAQYDNWAVGFKLGEPTGINLRKYFNSINAIDVTVGTYGGILSNQRDYRQGEYRNVGVSFQIHYLWHHPLFNAELVQFYYGFGPQINSRRYYPDGLRSQTPNYQSNISLGGSGLGGLEYYLPDGRLSIFLEGGLYAELLPRLLYTSPNVSAGIRLNL
ncbi:hypothetical protein GCM10027275_17070 [Rhabdobacter roseus]|uniref:Outer membrane protein beta-barrel domain-containing protein n=1 Tax=Rhabdobacter roseus TaxID=1655419 RepID=A0A840TJN4_9BACT|nr:hypothetical protein [Rhabdobacter roseus]MBB5283631.1 hypothetical protein [Rhabdobacter roseus]